MYTLTDNLHKHTPNTYKPSSQSLLSLKDSDRWAAHLEADLAEAETKAASLFPSSNEKRASSKWSDPL